MFLVTTALEKFWDTSKEILFLGEWCKLYSRKHIWEKLNYRTLPYHWDDRRKLFADYLYLDGVYEKYLSRVADLLNMIHGLRKSKRYWRIIIGPWLFYFVEILFDRYESIKKAASSGEVKNTWVSDYRSNSFPPIDFNHFFTEAIDDPYNHLLYSYIIPKTSTIPYKIVDTAINLKGPEAPSTEIRGTKYFLLKLLSFYTGVLPERYKQYVFIHSYLKWIDIFSLQVKLGQFPSLYFGQSVRYPTCPINDQMRKKMVLRDGDSEFEKILDELIPLQIPRLYVEGFRAFYEEVYRHLPQRTHLIFTANASIGIESFKFWAADQAEKGAKLVLTQHGGHHGMGLISAELKHETNIADCYFTWGWTDKNNNKIKPMPSGQLHKYRNKVKPSKDGFVLWVMMGLPRYSYWLYSLPIGPQFLSYIDDQRRFYESLQDSVKEKILMKPYMKDFGWNDRMRYHDLMPKVRQYTGRRNMIELLKESKLFVGTYNSTTYLETFAADFPTIIFWDPDHWELRTHVRPLFETLREAGILHYSPESAARKVNEVFSDPFSWWKSKEVQSAKDLFCRKFALINSHWKDIWSEELRKIAEGA